MSDLVGNPEDRFSYNEAHSELKSVLTVLRLFFPSFLRNLPVSNRAGKINGIMLVCPPKKKESHRVSRKSMRPSFFNFFLPIFFATK